MQLTHIALVMPHYTGQSGADYSRKNLPFTCQLGSEFHSSLLQRFSVCDLCSLSITGADAHMWTVFVIAFRNLCCWRTLWKARKGLSRASFCGTNHFEPL